MKRWIHLAAAFEQHFYLRHEIIAEYCTPEPMLL